MIIINDEAVEAAAIAMFAATAPLTHGDFHSMHDEVKAMLRIMARVAIRAYSEAMEGDPSEWSLVPKRGGGTA